MVVKNSESISLDGYPRRSIYKLNMFSTYLSGAYVTGAKFRSLKPTLLSGSGVHTLCAILGSRMYAILALMGGKECFDDTTPALDSFDTIGGQLLASIFARGGFHVLTIELIVNLQPCIDSASSIEIPSLTPRLQTNHTDF